jgi:hypothetical protein
MFKLRQCNIIDKVCQWLATGRWFSPDTPVSSTNKTDRHDIAEIVFYTINLRPKQQYLQLRITQNSNSDSLYAFKKNKEKQKKNKKETN